MGVYLAGSGWSFRDTGSGSNFAQSAFRGFEKISKKGNDAHGFRKETLSISVAQH